MYFEPGALEVTYSIFDLRLLLRKLTQTLHERQPVYNFKDHPLFAI